MLYESYLNHPSLCVNQLVRPRAFGCHLWKQFFQGFSKCDAPPVHLYTDLTPLILIPTLLPTGFPTLPAHSPNTLPHTPPPAHLYTGLLPPTVLPAAASQQGGQPGQHSQLDHLTPYCQKVRWWSRLTASPPAAGLPPCHLCHPWQVSGALSSWK